MKKSPYYLISFPMLLVAMLAGGIVRAQSNYREEPKNRPMSENFRKVVKESDLVVEGRFLPRTVKPYFISHNPSYPIIYAGMEFKIIKVIKRTAPASGRVRLRGPWSRPVKDEKTGKTLQFVNDVSHPAIGFPSCDSTSTFNS